MLSLPPFVNLRILMEFVGSSDEDILMIKVRTKRGKRPKTPAPQTCDEKTIVEMPATLQRRGPKCRPLGGKRGSGQSWNSIICIIMYIYVYIICIYNIYIYIYMNNIYK